MRYTGIAVLIAATVWPSLMRGGEGGARPSRSVLVVRTWMGEKAFRDLPIIRRLAESHWQVGSCNVTDIRASRLSRFGVVVITDLSRLLETAKKLTGLQATRAHMEAVGRELNAYLAAGGALWIFGRSTHHMGSGEGAAALNVVLQPWGAAVPQEVIRDPKHEQVQSRYMRMRYAFTDRIARHPLTTGVPAMWYPTGTISGSPTTSPLRLSADWTPLVRSMPTATTRVIEKTGSYFIETEKTGALADGPVMAAVRQVGKGRVLLTGFIGTIPFFGHGHLAWDWIMAARGFGDRPSHYLRFFLHSLGVLADASPFGGYVYKPTPIKEPGPTVINWATSRLVAPNVPVHKGVIGAATRYSDGRGTVADYVKTARALGVDFIVFTEDLKRITHRDFKRLVKDCEAASGDDFAAIPGLRCQDADGNHYVIAGERCWPGPKHLRTKDRTVFRPNWHWILAGFPLKAYYSFSRNNHPPHTLNGFNAVAVATYDHGQLIDEAFDALLENTHKATLPAPVVVNLTRSPGAMKKISTWYYLPAENMKRLSHFLGVNGRAMGHGLRLGYVSNGPRLVNWRGHGCSRWSATRFAAPDTERWRVALKAEADVPLKTVEVFDNRQVVRRYRPTGRSFDTRLDGVHDRRRALIARVTDTAGRWAVGGYITIADPLFNQFQCGDRQNFMGGSYYTRDDQGRLIRLPATGMLRQATWPCVGTPKTFDPRRVNPPGIDGGLGSGLSVTVPFLLRGKNRDEFRKPVFRNHFSTCSRSAILFDLDYTHRFAMETVPWPNLDRPWQHMEPARYFDARLVQYHFPRRYNGFSATLADMDMRFTRPVELSRVYDPDMGKNVFWTHRAGFHHPEFRYPGPQLGKFVDASSAVYQDHFPSLLLWASQGEATDSEMEYCSIVSPDGSKKTIRMSQAWNKPSVWQGGMRPGSYMVFHPCLGGAKGFVALAGALQLRVELARDWMRVYAGLYEQRRFEPGDTYAVRVLLLQSPIGDKDVLGAWNGFRDAFGLAGGKPAYTLDVKRGRVVSTAYVLDIEARDGGVVARIGKADLAQRLPIRVRGLSDRCTAAMVDNTRRQWYPIGVVSGTAYATHETRTGASDLYVGQLVRSSDPALWCTVLPEGKGFMVDVHNPSATPRSATLTVPGGLWMIKPGTRKVDVPAGQTRRIEW